MRSALALSAALALLAPGDARAAPRRFAWLWDTDTLPQRAVELEWWISERTGYDESIAALTIATVVGLTDTLELAVPVEAAWRPATDQTQLETYGLEVRWRLAAPDRARAGPVVPFVRAAVYRQIQLDAALLEGDAVVSVDLGDRLRAVLDLGVIALTRGTSVDGIGGVGLSFAVTDELHVGAELYGERTIASDRPNEAWLAVGPNVSLTYGRFWITAALPIGLGHGAPDFLPRVIWATAF